MPLATTKARRVGEMKIAGWSWLIRWPGRSNAACYAAGPAIGQDYRACGVNCNDAAARNRSEAPARRQQGRDRDQGERADPQREAAGARVARFFRREPVQRGVIKPEARSSHVG